MKARNRIYKWLIALWLLMSCQPVLCAYQPATLPSAWRTTPTLSEDIRPAYQFQSTSTFATTTHVTVYTPGSGTPYGAPYRQFKGGDIDEEEDPEGDPSGDPQGYIDTPVGEPWVLLLMALVFLIAKNGRFRCKNAQKE